MMVATHVVWTLAALAALAAVVAVMTLVVAETESPSGNRRTTLLQVNARSADKTTT